ncbi:MAG TPA: DUF480 domain-containing protein [Pirellulales bacterium]|nr:DUF480 domain-containing protein [Pirellulales bacterium]
MSSESSTDIPAPAERRWTPLPAKQRRVLGVLLEKAKTTPDAYPMTLNAIRVGCNQKNNRAPIANYEPDDVQDALDDLRHRGAAAEVQGSGRVAKYRHYFYEWLGVNKLESAVMAELLLRGPQTEGELRGRASRMEPINDLEVLREVLRGLKAKGLVVPLTSEGRGHVVTHGLYPPEEFERVQTQFASGAMSAGVEEASEPRATPAAIFSPDAEAELRGELAKLRDEVAELRREVDKMRGHFGLG